MCTASAGAADEVDTVTEVAEASWGGWKCLSLARDWNAE
jgi:hypothetical protein